MNRFSIEKIYINDFGLAIFVDEHKSLLWNAFKFYISNDYVLNSEECRSSFKNIHKNFWYKRSTYLICSDSIILNENRNIY